MPRIIGGNNLDTLKTWVDASYATHQDMRGHTGGIMSLGHGVVAHKSTKQKLNAKSSTETEVIGASDYLPWAVWAKRFMKGQGYELNTNIFYQDNESAMRMEKNGRKSCREKSRHIHIRYFFIKDVLKRERMTLRHCGTDEMLADFYTKPLTGSKFNVMRDVLMGLAPLLIEERVGEKPNYVIKDKMKNNQELSINREPKSMLKLKNGNLADEAKITRTYADVCRNITN